MRDDLDDLLAQLGAWDDGVRPPALDVRVRRSIARRRADALTAKSLAPVRVLAVGFAVAVGVAAGGMAAATTRTEPRQFSTFSSQAHLAPSTLLEGAAG